MSYEISLSGDGSYILIKVFEAINGAAEKEFAEKAISNARQHSIKKFLVDVREAFNVASPLDQYLFGYEDILKFGLQKDSKIAILAHKNDKSHDFIETLLMNAGYHCCLFREEDAALGWLRA